MNERDMFYNGYSYGGFAPMQPYSNPMMPNNYTSSQFNDMNERIGRLERQIKRLDQRLNRLETPYANNSLEPDNNMYMM